MRHGGGFRGRRPNQYPVFDVVTRALGEAAKRPEVTSFFDEPTNTASHVVADPASRRCGVIDSVLDYDAASGRTATRSADQLIAFIRKQGLEVEWILATSTRTTSRPRPTSSNGSAARSASATTFVSSRTSSAGSSMPGPNSSATAASSTKLILPSVQVNMRPGEFPPAEDDGQTYLKIPLNQP